MEDTYLYVIYAVVLLILLNSVLTVLFGSIKWLIEKYEWKARIGILVVFILLGLYTYVQFEDFFHLLLQKIQ